MEDGYEKGELVMTSKPYVYALNDCYRGKLCDFCFGSSKNPNCCDQCNFVYFCSPECEENSREDHKDECAAFKKMPSGEYTVTTVILTRIILKLKKYGYDNAWEMVGNNKRYYADLMSHNEYVKNDSELQELLIYQHNRIEGMIGDENIPSLEEMSKMFGKVLVNVFAIYDASMDRLGCGLYFGASFFDHSCDPNAEYVFNGVQMTIRAVRDIPHRDLRQIYVCYIDQLQFTEDRRKILSDSYFFTCQCSRCVDPHHDELMKKLLVREEEAKERITNAKATLRRLREMKKNDEPHESLYETASSELSAQKGILASTHFYHVKTLEFVYNSCVSMHKWEDAIEFATQLINPYKLYYHEYHPQYCLHIVNIATVQRILYRNKEAEANLKEAKEAVRICFGCDHPFYEQVEDSLLACQKELAC